MNFIAYKGFVFLIIIYFIVLLKLCKSIINYLFIDTEYCLCYSLPVMKLMTNIIMVLK